jgi:hypothetical protein
LGRITDSTGAVVSGAKVELQQLAGKKNDNAFSDAKGQFKFSDLPPGRYQLRVVVPGFRMHSQLVEVKLQEMATVKPELQVGSAMDSVTVTSGAPILHTAPTETLSESGPPELGLLPSKLPAALTASHGKIMVAVDTAGALFYSENSGTAWKPVQPVWQGKVIGLISPAEAPQPPSVAFQLTTGDANAVWLSRDGRHWYSAAPQH